MPVPTWLPEWLPEWLRPAAQSVPRECRCGHEPRAHEHYRRGSDCALCSCARFRAGQHPVAEQTPPPGPSSEPLDRTGSPRDRIRLVA